MRKGALEGAEPAEAAAFWQEIASLQRQTTAAGRALAAALKKVKALREALARTPATPGDLDQQLHSLRRELLDLDATLNGPRAHRMVGEKYPATIGARLGTVMTGTSYSTYGPTPMLRTSLDIARREYQALKVKLDAAIYQQLPQLEKALHDAGAPWLPGQPLPQD